MVDGESSVHSKVEKRNVRNGRNFGSREITAVGMLGILVAVESRLDNDDVTMRVRVSHYQLYYRSTDL